MNTKCILKYVTYIDKPKKVFICWKLIVSYLLHQLRLIATLQKNKHIFHIQDI